jgi:flagellin-like hook-associated protein FlgL
MELRVSLQTLVGRAIANVRRQTAELAVSQQQAATGKRILAPSDDPLGTIAVLGHKSRGTRLETHVANIQSARGTLEASSLRLREIGQLFTNAKVLAIEGANAVNDQSGRQAIAQQVDSLLDRLLGLANAEHNGRALFAGAAGDVTPFVVESRDAQGRPLAVRYHGASQRDQVQVGEGTGVATLYAGAELLQSRQRSTSIFTGDTGVAAGLGTDSAVGQGLLQVRHTLTTFAAGSGVSAGTSSAAGDTILGPAGAHQLILNDTSGTGVSGTVSLDGGEALAWSSADTDLVVAGPTGERVHINTSAITPGFNGVVAITADGTLSVDGGASTLAIDFSANQVVTNSLDGAVTNVRSADIRRTGDEHIDYRGTYDAFQILLALRDDLRNTRGLGPFEQSQFITQRIEELDRIRGNVLEAVGEQGAALQNLDTLEAHARDLNVEVERLTGELEGADLSEVILQLQAQENQLRTTLATTARIFDTSLLDFIR